jgi:hypothetical protein
MEEVYLYYDYNDGMMAHRPDCGHCNYGLGCHGAAFTSSEWRGPYSLPEARQVAAHVGVTLYFTCRCCR